MSDTDFFNPAMLIQEVKNRPGLYKTDHPSDREEKLALWKEVGAAMYSDWDTFNKATAYDKVLQLQRKWRSLRDAYNRELRVRKSGCRNRKVYKYFKKMSFLGGFEGPISDDDEDQDMLDVHSDVGDNLHPEETPKPKSQKITKKARRKIRKRRSTSSSAAAPEEMEMPMFPLEITSDDNDSDKLFMLSFLPEMRQLPPNVKMWVRAQIASVMQEAVTCQYTNTLPGTGASVDRSESDLKRSRYDSNE